MHRLDVDFWREHCYIRMHLKIYATIQNAFPICVHGAALPQTGRLLLLTLYIPKSLKTVQLCLWTSGASFRSSRDVAVTKTWTSDGKVSEFHHQF